MNWLVSIWWQLWRLIIHFSLKLSENQCLHLLSMSFRQWFGKKIVINKNKLRKIHLGIQFTLECVLFLFSLHPHYFIKMMLFTELFTRFIQMCACMLFYVYFCVWEIAYVCECMSVFVRVLVCLRSAKNSLKGSVDRYVSSFVVACTKARFSSMNSMTLFETF